MVSRLFWELPKIGVMITMCPMTKPGPKPRYNEKVIRTTFRLPKSLHEKLKEKAASENISINDYLIKLIDSAVNDA